MHSLALLALEQANSHAIILLDPQGTIVSWLGGAESTLGYSAEEAVGRSISMIFLPEDVAQGVPELERDMAAQTGEADDDRRQVRKDGGRIWVSGAVTPLYDEGRLVGFVKILRDRTDLKTHQEALESRAEYERQRNERKDVFIATLAHDLRNPLLAVRLAADLLEECSSPSEDAGHALKTIRGEVEFVRKMIDNLLESTRSATGKIHLNKQPRVLQEFVREVVAGFQRPDLRLQVLMHATPIEVEIDPIRMRQALSNLVDNAVKHTPAGGVIRVKVSLEGEDVLLRVEDTGRGIAPEHLQHIFDLFSQAEPLGESVGLGLGLSIVKDIVMLHGGTVQALSHGVGKGSAFIVRLPARR